ncbi:hypothetical protein Tco_0026504 [Tanacetum coccineum]
MIIIDPDDQPMWESAKTVAPTSNYVIVRPDVDDNFVINSTHLKMILENKFDGQLQADPHDHIREFLAQNEKNFQTIYKIMERKIDELEKTQNIPLEQTDRTDPPPPPQAQTEHVNVVFTGSGESDDSLKTQKDPHLLSSLTIK